MDRYEFVTDCVHSTAEKIGALIDKASPISYRTLRKYVSASTLNEMFGYDRKLPFKKDWHVRYYKSKYVGFPCVYVAHSAIEYIFCAPGAKQRLLRSGTI